MNTAALVASIDLNNLIEKKIFLQYIINEKYV